jgi:hypothetical protein
VVYSKALWIFSGKNSSVLLINKNKLKLKIKTTANSSSLIRLFRQKLGGSLGRRSQKMVFSASLPE